MVEESKVEPINYIEFEDFLKVELIVGEIVECEAVPGSDKLLKLQVDFGIKGKRQVLSGIQKSFAPQELIGQQGVFVYNLKPRKMMGLESQGMLLSVLSDGKLRLASVAGKVENGSRLV